MIPQNSMRVYLALGSTDLRKAINGLSLLAEQAMGLNPFSGDLFVFCNRRQNIIKILYWDENGFFVYAEFRINEKIGCSRAARMGPGPVLASSA
jgi:transposase